MATKTLNFQKSGSEWIAEETVTGDYILHIERLSGGLFSISQRATATGQYQDCQAFPEQDGYPGPVIDWAFKHGVYPEEGVHIRIVSGSEVTMGVLVEGKQ